MRKIVYKEHKGAFVKKCPCSPDRVSCGYYIVTPGIGCPFSCSYCFMNYYVEDFSEIILYSNTDALLSEFVEFADSKRNEKIRIGSGEFIDSLAVPELDKLNFDLIETVRSRPWVQLEFKTKSARVQELLKIKPAENVVISWTLNIESVIKEEEINTSSLDERLNAARLVADHGFSTSFHFDPIYMSDPNLEKYLTVVDRLSVKIPVKTIRWISLGGFRYVEELKLAIMERSAGGKAFLGEEFLRSADNKYRYPSFVRHKFYSEMNSRIKEKIGTWVYLCMEDKNMWEKIF